MQPQVEYYSLAPSWMVVVGGVDCSQCQCSPQKRIDQGAMIIVDHVQCGQVGATGLLQRFQALCVDVHHQSIAMACRHHMKGVA